MEYSSPITVAIFTVRQILCYGHHDCLNITVFYLGVEAKSV
jgi:hypothetical protein